MTPRELEEKLGWAPQSSLRAAVTNLSDLGALTRVNGSGSPGAPTELTEAGHELLPVADALERWLGSAPVDPIPLEDPAAQGIVRVLTAGWDSTIVRALAEQPHTLIELSARISDLNYPALKRRLGKLRSTQLVVPTATENGTAYEASEWLRRAIVPLTLAGRWERRHSTGTEPISAIEVEAAFLLTLPLAELPLRSTGVCALAVLTSEEQTGAKRDVAGVAVEVKGGAIVSCSAGAASSQPTWALGTVDAWLEALVDGRSETLRVSGTKPRLATSIIKALHTTLFNL